MTLVIEQALLISGWRKRSKSLEGKIIMDFANIKLPIAVIGIIVAQAFGIIWYVAQLDSTVKNLDISVATIQESVHEEFDDADLRKTIDALEDSIDELETTIAIIENEYRTIMSDHNSFADALKALGEAGVLPSGEKRIYGGYD